MSDRPEACIHSTDTKQSTRSRDATDLSISTCMFVSTLSLPERCLRRGAGIDVYKALTIYTDLCLQTASENLELSVCMVCAGIGYTTLQESITVTVAAAVDAGAEDSNDHAAAIDNVFVMMDSCD